MPRPIFENPAYRQTDAPSPTDTPPTSLDNIDRAICTLQLSDHSILEIALILTLPRDEVATRIGHPAYQALKRAIERGILTRVAEVRSAEPITRAKAAAPDAMGTMIRLARNAKENRIRLKAAEGVLKFAGVEPPKRVELTAPDRLLDLMTVQELAALADKKIWPSRFKDQLRHLLPAPSVRDFLDITPQDEEGEGEGDAPGDAPEADASPHSDDPSPDDEGPSDPLPPESPPEEPPQDWDAPPPEGDGGLSNEKLARLKREQKRT